MLGQVSLNAQERQARIVRHNANGRPFDPLRGYGWIDNRLIDANSHLHLNSMAECRMHLALSKAKY